VNGIETQDVDVEIRQPVERVVAEVASHLVEPGPSKLMACPQGVEYRSVKYVVVSEVVSLGAEMVVDGRRGATAMPCRWEASTSSEDPGTP